MTDKLGKDGWPTDETVIDARDKEIESLRQQLAELEDDEQKAVERCVIAEQRLAECQAREKMLRDAAGKFYDGSNGEVGELTRALKAALAMPSDSTALDTLKKQWQREALLKTADYVDTFSISNDTPVNAIAWHIRRMAEELKETKETKETK